MTNSRIRFTYALATAALTALLIWVGAQAAANGNAGMDDEITVEGVLTDEGVTCPALRSDSDELYTLAGNLGDLETGARMRVTGRVAEASICMQGTTIAVSRITRMD